MKGFLSSLRFRLILLVVLATVPSAGLILYSSEEHRREMRGAACEDVLHKALDISAQHELLAKGARQLLAGLAGLREVRTQDSKACSAILAKWLQGDPLYANIIVVDAQGELWCSGLPFEGPLNYADRLWFQEVVLMRGFVDGGYVMGRTTHRPVAAFAYPVLNEAGELQGVISTGLDVGWVYGYAERTALPQETLVMVIDASGTVLARTKEREAWVGKQVPEAEIFRTVLASGGPGTAEALGVDGVRRLYAFAPLARGSWVVVGVPTAWLYADEERVLTRALIGLGLVALLAFAAAWAGGHYFLVRQIKALVAAARRVGEGDFSARTNAPYSAGELGQLARSFDKMAENLEKAHLERTLAEASLRSSEARMTHLVSVSPTVIYSLRPEDFSPTWVSPNVSTLVGYTPDEALEPGWWVEHLHPEDRQRVLFNRAKLLKKGEVVHEYRLYRKDGQLIWVQDQMRLLRDAQGVPVEIVGAWTDITRRKDLEQEVMEQLETLNCLYASAQKLAQSMDLMEAASGICRSCVEIFGAALAWCGLAEEDGRVRVIAQFPEDNPYPRQITVRWDETTEGQGPTGHAIRSGLPQVVSDVITDSHFAPWREAAKALGFATGAAFPLVSGGRILGSMNVYSEKRGFFTPETLDAFQALANQAASALENALLFADIKQKVNELEVIFAMSTGLRKAQTVDDMLRLLLAEVRATFAVDVGLVALLDSEGQRYTIAAADGYLSSNIGRTFGIEEGISGKVLRSREPYATDDYASEPKRLGDLEHGDRIGPAAFLPLLSEEELVGVLMVGRTRGPQAQPFTKGELRLMRAISEMAGNALRRMSLYAETLRRMREVQALRNIDMAITGSLDPRVTLRVLVDEVITQLEVDAAAVLLLDPHTLELRFAAGRGFLTKGIERTCLRLGEGYAGQAALERRILVLEDLPEAEDFNRHHLIQKENFKAYCVAPMISKGKVLGVLETFHRSPLNAGEQWLYMLEALAAQAAIAVDNARLFADLERANIHLQHAYEATIEGWSKALDFRDKETEGHTQRVTELTLALAREMGASGEELAHVRRGALLHDMGKMGVPDSILLKPGPLTEEEWEIMRRHPKYAFEMLSAIEYLRPALDIPHYHHEKWDGTGYPHGLKGEQIPLSARIFAVVDVWDALTSDRPYRRAWSGERALAYIQEQAGKHFDPKVVEMFVKMIADENKEGAS